jgi:8-amino-7-oxononanoate synthase
LIDYLVNRARTFIFSTAPVPAAAAAALAGVRFVQSNAGAERRTTLWQLVDSLRPKLASSNNRSAILPVMIGDEQKAVETATALRKQGVFIPAIRYPTVARGQARLRLTVTAAHTAEDLGRLTSEFANLKLTNPSPVPAHA